MDVTLDNLLGLLQRATCPEDIFGALTGDRQAALKRRYRDLMFIVHPDRNPGCGDQANTAFQAVQMWYGVAQRQVADDSYGRTPRIAVSTRLHQYRGYQPPLSGDLCDLFPADSGGGRVLLKVARSAHSNDLLQAEAEALQRLERELAGQPVRAHFPTLVEHFLLRDEGGSQRHTNVLRAESEYVTLAEVLRAYPGGLNPADAAWMFNRMLAALGVAHGLGLVHGAVLPSHVLIRPSDHNGMLLDWCYSVPIGQPLKALSTPYAAEYPPEVLAKQPATPATDLYMAARCLVRLLGGNSDMQLPTSVPKAIAALLRACLIPAPQRRMSDAWQLFDDFRETLHQIYGSRKFRPFRMPQ